MATSSITFNGIAYYNGGRIPSSGFNGGSTIAYAGYSDNGYHATEIRFTTPNFSGGESKNMTITLALVKGGSGGNSSVPLRWAISSTNDLDYYLGTGASSDPGIVSQGTFTASGLNSQIQQFTVMSNASVVGLQGNSTYYFYLWSQSASSTGNFVQVWGYNNCSGSVLYGDTDPGGYVYIDNGSSFQKYSVWIDNGTSFERYIPYIDNGSSWEKYGG